VVFMRDTWRVFLAGALRGIALMASVWAGFAWWKPHYQRTAEDDLIYDHCLATEGGNTVACDAMMRLIIREKITAAAMKQKAAELLAAGFSKREVVKWASDQGFVGSDLSDAVGISLRDLQTDNY
jgi:hypothetical protein